MAENFVEDCPKCHCQTADCLDYDDFIDSFLMKCDECEYTYWADNNQAVYGSD